MNFFEEQYKTKCNLIRFILSSVCFMKQFWISIGFIISSFLSFAQVENKTMCSGHKNGHAFLTNTYVTDSALLDYDVTFYKIDLEVNDTSTFIRGYTEIQAISNVSQLNEMVLELTDELVIDSAEVDDNSINGIIHNNEIIRISLFQPSAKGEIITVRIYYHGEPSGSGFFAGISNREDNLWNKRVTYTLSEPFHAKDWFPCKQVLHDKADSAYIFITTPGHLHAGSNGLLTNIIVLPDGRKRYEWKTHYPIAFYLLSITVADFQDFSIYARPSGSEDSILIQNYIYSDSAYLAENKTAIEATRNLVELFSELYSMYPFRKEKYGHCVAPMGGGMEHQTMTSLSSFSFNLVSHELGHQWFGDNVTCASWQDIWINEGFASYSEYLALEFLKTKADAEQWMEHAHYRALTEPEGSIYIPEEDASDEYRIFSNALSYKKGAAIIHMIRHELDNDSTFFQTLGAFQELFRDSVATGLDFKEVLENISGRKFSWFFDQWYFGEGYPLFNFTWWQTADSLTIYSLQEGSSAKTPFFKTKLDFQVIFENGEDTLLTVTQNTNVQYIQFALNDKVESIVPDPENWLLDVSFIIKKQISEECFRASPNPFQDEIVLEFKIGNIQREIVLTDLSGKIIYKITTTSQIQTISTLWLNPGMYILTVREGKERYSVKLIKE